MAGLAAGQSHTRRLAPRAREGNSATLNYWVLGRLGEPSQRRKAGQPDARTQQTHRIKLTQLSVSSRYAPAVSSPSTAVGSSGVISTNQPAPYGSVLITSGVSPSASLRAATVPLTGA